MSSTINVVIWHLTWCLDYIREVFEQQHHTINMSSGLLLVLLCLVCWCSLFYALLLTDVGLFNGLDSIRFVWAMLCPSVSFPSYSHWQLVFLRLSNGHLNLWSGSCGLWRNRCGQLLFPCTRWMLLILFNVAFQAPTTRYQGLEYCWTILCPFSCGRAWLLDMKQGT